MQGTYLRRLNQRPCLRVPLNVDELRELRGCYAEPVTNRSSLGLTVWVLLALAACDSAPANGRAVASPAATDGASMGGGMAPTSSRPKLLPRNDLAGLPNFAKVSDTLYRGAQPTAEGFRTLKSMGIKTVVSLRMLHSDRDLLVGTGLQYLRIEAKAWHPEDEDVARVLKIIEDPKNQPVFVHCQHGADRTGAMVAAYRIVEEGWSKDEAAAELPSFNYHPIWTEVMTYLRSFDRASMQEKIARTSLQTLDIVE